MKATLPTNYQDDILNVSTEGKRKYRMNYNDDGTVSFIDVTPYDQEGSDYGAGDINATNEAVNQSADAGKIIDDPDTAEATTEEGYIAGVQLFNHVKDSLNNLINKLYPYGFPLIPTMTSDTTPSGEVIYDSVNSTDYGYKAFDNSESTVWTSTATANGYIGYHFTEKVTAKKVYLYQAVQSGTNYRCNECKIQASNNGNDWVDLTDTMDISSSISKYITLNNTVGYEYYRLYIVNGSNNNRVGIGELQFYG